MTLRRRMEVKHGTTRVVFLVGRWALKVPALVEWHHFLLGLLGNMQEVTVSRAGWPELCPVLWSLPGGFLVVMRRADPLPRPEFDDFDLEAFCARDGYVVPAERKLDSFGLLDGRVVAVDYGDVP